MTDESQSKITPEDVKSVTDKLKAWIPTLPEQEQLVLGWVLARAAAAADEDVAEYLEQSEPGMPVSTLMAEATGLQDVGGYALSDPAIVIRPDKLWAFRW